MEKSKYIKLQSDGSAWTSESKVYDFSVGKYVSWGYKVDKYYLAFAEILGEQLYDDDVVLDIGCGDGSPLYKFSRSHICTPMGLDISEEKLKFCNQHFKNIETVCSLVEDIPLSNKSVDHVFCSHTLEHSYNLDKALKEINRIAKRVVFIAVPLEDKIMKTSNISHFNFSQDKNWWLKKYKKAGLKEISHHTTKAFMFVDSDKEAKAGYDLIYWGLAT